MENKKRATPGLRSKIQTLRVESFSAMVVSRRQLSDGSFWRWVVVVIFINFFPIRTYAWFLSNNTIELWTHLPNPCFVNLPLTAL